MVEFGPTSSGWLKKLKKSAVKRVFTFSVMLKVLNSERSTFQAPGPKKKFLAFQLTMSVTVVSRVLPSASRCGIRLLKSDPTDVSTRCDRSSGINCWSLL